MIKNIEEYLSGKYLYGDNLSIDEMKIWYEEEGEGYANLGAREANDYTYVYHALNDYHGYHHLNLPDKLKILGFGSAYGEELLPVIKQAVELTIIDPSEAFVSNKIRGVPCKYIKPEISGKLPFDDGEFDLITAFGVLHHVPNVTAVVSELSRVTKRGGTFLLREPIVSMGDWRKPRTGLTKHERGIPLGILREIINKSGFKITKEAFCVFPAANKLFKLIRNDIYNSRLATTIDAQLSTFFEWNINYHPQHWWQKFRPTSVFYILEKL